MQNENIVPFVPSPKNFYLMVLGQIVSVLGSSILRFALSLYVLDITGRADLFAALYAISSIPLLLAPLGGAIADRYNRRNLMVIVDFTNSVVVLCFYLLMLTGNASVISIGVVMVLLSIVNSIESPTATACIPLLVEEKKLEQSNGIVQAVQALSAVAAPVVGGILYGVLGINALVAISFSAFFLAAVMEIFIKIPFVKKAQAGSIVPALIKDMKEGFLYVTNQKFILKAGLVAILVNLVLTPYFLVGAPIVLRVTMEVSDTMYGVGMGLINFATILGALSIGFIAKKLKLKMMHLGLLTAAMLTVPMAVSVMPFMLGMGVAPPFILFMVGALPIAAGMTIFSIYIITKVQKVTPNEHLGKVMAIMMAMAQCVAPLGQMLYGVIFEVYKSKVFIPTFLVGVATILIALLTRHLFKHEEERA